MSSGRHDWEHECGVMAVAGNPAAAELVRFGLFALQHRGEESAGIAGTRPGGTGVAVHRGMGLVGEAIPDSAVAGLAACTRAIGHVRYSTTGSSNLTNAQPLPFNLQSGTVAIAHNGNITNAGALRARLESQGAIFQTSSDTEVIAHLMARLTGPTERRVRNALRALDGAFAVCIITPDAIYAARDRHGLRPLALGRLDDGWLVASESCGFAAVGGEYVRDVAPGEMVTIDDSGLRPRARIAPARPARCSFEHIYFARPDSTIDGRNVHLARKRMGARLWAEAPAPADVVIGVPDSSLSAAMGYAAAGQLPYDTGLVKSHYIGRTFIQPTREQREQGVQLKLTALRAVIAGRRVAMIDDSLVRGTTGRRIVRILREAGAAEVHVRIASPPVAHSCYYGIDTSARDELLAAHTDIAGIGDHIGADSIGFLSEAGLLAALDDASDGESAGDGWCNACFHGNYPTSVDADSHKLELEGAPA